MTVLTLFALGILAGTYGRVCLIATLAFAIIVLGVLVEPLETIVASVMCSAFAASTVQLGYLASVLSLWQSNPVMPVGYRE